MMATQRRGRRGDSGARAPHQKSIRRTMTAMTGAVALVAGMTLTGGLGAAVASASPTTTISATGMTAEITGQSKATGNQDDPSSYSTTSSTGACLKYASKDNPSASGSAVAAVSNPQETVASHGISTDTNANKCSKVTKISDMHNYVSSVGITPAAAPSSVSVDSAFLLGTLTHYNNEITSGSGEYFMGSFDINLSGITVDSQGSGDATFSYKWRLWETPNKKGQCRDGNKGTGKACDDWIYISSSGSNDATLAINGLKYTLTFVGFKDSAEECATTLDSASLDTNTSFWTQEYESTSSCMYGRLTPFATVNLGKTWEDASDNGDAVDLQVKDSSDGGTTVGTGHSTAPTNTATDADDAASANIPAGHTVTLSEAFDSGNAENYDQSLQCFYLDDNEQVPVQLGDDNSFTIGDDLVGHTINCTFTNTYISKVPTSLTVTKTWVINGTEYADGDQPDGFSATPTIDDKSAEFEKAYDGYSVGDTVTIGEDATYPEQCISEDQIPKLRSGASSAFVAAIPTRYDTATGVGEYELEDGQNSIELTNTYICAFLTLVKDVRGGDATAADWTLSATADLGDGETTRITGASGSPKVTHAAVAADWTWSENPTYYTLSESGPAGYHQASLSCTIATWDGEELVTQDLPITDGQIPMELGDDVTCTFVNVYDEPNPNPNPEPIDVQPATAAQCTLGADDSAVLSDVHGVPRDGVSYTVTDNKDGTFTVTAVAASGYALKLPAGWSGDAASASKTVTPSDNDVVCVGGESDTQEPPPTETTTPSPTPSTTPSKTQTPKTSSSVEVLGVADVQKVDQHKANVKPNRTTAYTGVPAYETGLIALLLLAAGGVLLLVGARRTRTKRQH